MYWFDQVLDHTEYQTANIRATWKQRYFVFGDYYNASVGPIILYICGEAECRGISNTSFTAQIAK
jgi:hypothetical protein